MSQPDLVEREYRPSIFGRSVGYLADDLREYAKGGAHKKRRGKRQYRNDLLDAADTLEYLVETVKRLEAEYVWPVWKLP